MLPTRRTARRRRRREVLATRRAAELPGLRQEGDDRAADDQVREEVAGNATDAVQPEHAGVYAADIGGRAHAEQHPADDDEHEGDGDRERTWQAPAPLPQMMRA